MRRLSDCGLPPRANEVYRGRRVSAKFRSLGESEVARVDGRRAGLERVMGPGSRWVYLGNVGKGARVGERFPVGSGRGEDRRPVGEAGGGE